MKALIWKEVRELAWPFGGLFAAIVLLVLVSIADKESEGAFELAAAGCALLPPLFASWVGAYALARERSGGTLEFMGSLPISRGRLWATKLGVALVGFVLLYAVLADLILLAGGMLGEQLLPIGSRGVVIGVFSAITLLPLAIGFAVSGVRRNPFESLLVTWLLLLLIATGWLFLAADVLPRVFGPWLGITLDATPPSTYVLLAVTLSAVWLVASGVVWRTCPWMSYRSRHWKTAVWVAGLLVLVFPASLVGVHFLSHSGRADLQRLEDPQVSPDGNWIAFTDTRLERDTPRLWVMRSDGSDLKCLALAPVGYDCRGSPDSRSLDFLWGDENSELSFLADGNSSRPWEVSVPEGRLRRFASGDWYDILREWPPEQDYHRPAAGAGMPDLKSDQWNVVYERYWSVDGQRVAFRARFEPSAQPEWKPPKNGGRGKNGEPTESVRPRPLQLFTVRADGTGLRRLLVGTGPYQDELWLGGWTREGKIVAQIEQNRLVSIDPDTGRQTALLQSSVSDQEARP